MYVMSWPWRNTVLVCEFGITVNFAQLAPEFETRINLMSILRENAKNFRMAPVAER
jgi:hypothetical protein